jgi:hypothetical protein
MLGRKDYTQEEIDTERAMAEKSVLKLKAGDVVKLSEADFVRLFKTAERLRMLHLFIFGVSINEQNESQG